MKTLRSFLVVAGCLAVIAWAGLRVRWAMLPSTIVDRSAAQAMAKLASTPFTHDRNFTEIEPDLFLGGYIANPPCGCDAVLNLCEDEDPYSAPHHKWTPIPDASPAPSRQWLREAVDFVAEQRGQNRPTYVHCRAGVSRGAMVVTAYLMEKNRWTRDEALEFVRRSRPIAAPNPAFMELLKEWETLVR